MGCKKDLKKSAKFYRAAESKGISMIGNSWYVVLFLFLIFLPSFLYSDFSSCIMPNNNRIYKSKYNDEEEDKVGGSPGKKGGKEHHKRNLFGRAK